ncbi:MAG: hypothetical protein CMI26_05640 [Opitutae bacterium]|jgi:hypothetical protein|nr:hypothetical protein [Opitutae bacterium]
MLAIATMFSLSLGVCFSVDFPGETFFPKDRTKSLFREKALVTYRCSLNKPDDFARSVRSLILFNELKGGVQLQPDRQSKVGIKLSTHFAPGLATPLPLVDALLDFLKARGFASESVFLLDLESRGLRRSGILPPRSKGGNRYRGHAVVALDSRIYFDERWFHESPMPPSADYRARLSLRYPREREVRLREERRSYLPTPLFLEDAFWINLPVAIDSRSLGIDAAVGNASLHAVDNNSRFLGRSTTAPSAATEILAIPEYWEKHLFSILDLSRFQYAGGSKFDAQFVGGEPTLMLSENPLSVDYFAMEALSKFRSAEGFDFRDTEKASLFRFGEDLGLARKGKAQLVDLP